MCRNQVTCPKCEGRKTIDAFRGYANGVCFMCEGNGTIQVKLHESPRFVPTADQIRKAEFILNATADQLGRMTYGQLDRAREFALSEFSLVAYPGLVDVWGERCEPYFQAAQSAKLARQPIMSR